jgi:acetolactate synthase-1/2/3 large subunit
MSWDDPYSHWALKCLSWKNKWVTGLPKGQPKNGVFSIYHVINFINNTMWADSIVVTDAGSPSYVCPVNLHASMDRRFIFSQSQADMGFAIPASIGVAIESNKDVIVIVGDGSFMSNLQELSTIKGMNLPIKIIVLNNNGYMSIKNTQKNFYNNRIYGVDKNTGVHIPNMSKIADGFDIPYIDLWDYYSNTYNEKSLCFSNVLKNKQCMIIEAFCEPDEEIIPMQSFKIVDGKKIQAGLDDMYPFLPSEELE